MWTKSQKTWRRPTLWDETEKVAKYGKISAYPLREKIYPTGPKSLYFRSLSWVVPGKVSRSLAAKQQPAMKSVSALEVLLQKSYEFQSMLKPILYSEITFLPPNVTNIKNLWKFLFNARGGRKIAGASECTIAVAHFFAINLRLHEKFRLIRCFFLELEN